MTNKIKNITDENFKKYLLTNKKYLLVDFWATWCAPCQSLSVILKEIYNQYQDCLKIIKIDVEKNIKLTSKYSVQSIPTLILFKKDQVIDKNIGFLSKEQLCLFLNKHMQ
ncbi:thioredoxin [Buchnera aphidicola]|uniref:thioredoxin n=1 Tax=Buchnera aphidicola TaxID=9 RepID=UPI002238A23D|nr:thioredoxin [Buchnera aphidicola]MCW5197432.1 thioredoxin [Buchnera aphidicola (Chaitophorus viminalis)]